MESNSRALAAAAAAVVAIWIWQFATVRANYGGNWTGLFLIGSKTPVPSSMRGESLYIFPDSRGYDGAAYHAIAHDPLMRSGSERALDAPAFRLRRILVPALAWTMALGRSQWIDRSYFAVILGFAFLGVYWTARFAQQAGFRAAWGWLFVLTPASVASIDRMTVDIALAALTAGFGLYAPRFRPMFVLLAAAALVRETGWLLAVAYALFLLSRRHYGRALTAASALVPALAWYTWLARESQRHHWIAAESYVGWVPLQGFVHRWLHPHHYVLSKWRAISSVGADYLGLAAIAVTLILVGRAALARRWTPAWAGAYAFAILACLIDSPDLWSEVYAFGRVFTPLVLLVAFETVHTNRAMAVLPTLLFVPNLAFVLWRQVAGIAVHFVAWLRPKY